MQKESMVAESLASRWCNLTVSLACMPPVAEKIGVLIWDAYQQFFRYYHRLSHLDDCFIHLDEVREWLSQPALVEYALWFHDIVCVPNSKSNECMSAAVAVYAADQLALPTAFAGQAAKLISLTSHQQMPDSEDGKYLVDIDLLVLGREWKRFLDYERQIRAEYGHMPELDYHQGRLRVIEAFLRKGTIYQTDYFQDRYESAAKRNLEALGHQLAKQ